MWLGKEEDPGFLKQNFKVTLGDRNNVINYCLFERDQCQVNWFIQYLRTIGDHTLAFIRIFVMVDQRTN